MRDILARPAPEVAPLLLGAVLSTTSPEGTVAVELTEVEAYEGKSDPASHAYRGMTARNEVMFGEAGHVYVYRSHGLHWCMNLVTGTPGTASAVLLRAGRVVEGLEVAQHRRGEKVALRSLARGPGCLAQALGVTGADNAADVVASDGLTLTMPSGEAGPVSTGPRVGVTLAPDVPWRFWISADPSVSAYRRSPRASEPTSGG